jgi:hypothetical protein
MFKHRLLRIVLMITAAFALSGRAAAAEKELRVGLLTDLKCTDAKSREAAWRVLSTSPGIKAERITSGTFAGDAFREFDVLVFPGGTGSGQAKMLGVDGGKKVTEFIREGHGLIAICAGGYLVVEGWSPETSAIELLNASLWDSKHWARGEQFIGVKVVGEKDAESSRTMWFENGPIFVPAQIPGLQPYVPLVRYVSDLAAKGAPTGMMTGRDAVIAAPFGTGRVVAFGPHPELSADLNHWLINAVKWSAAKDDGTSPTVAAVLEGRRTE